MILGGTYHHSNLPIYQGKMSRNLLIHEAPIYSTSLVVENSTIDRFPAGSPMGFPSTHLLCGFPRCGRGAGWHLSGNLGHQQARYSPNATAVPCEIVYLYTVHSIYIYMSVCIYLYICVLKRYCAKTYICLKRRVKIHRWTYIHRLKTAGTKNVYMSLYMCIDIDDIDMYFDVRMHVQKW